MWPAVRGILARTVSAYLRRKVRICGSCLWESCPATCRTERHNARAPRNYAAAVSFGISIVPLNFGFSGSRPKLSA